MKNNAVGGGVEPPRGS